MKFFKAMRKIVIEFTLNEQNKEKFAEDVLIDLWMIEFQNAYSISPRTSKELIDMGFSINAEALKYAVNIRINNADYQCRGTLIKKGEDQFVIGTIELLASKHSMPIIDNGQGITDAKENENIENKNSSEKEEMLTQSEDLKDLSGQKEEGNPVAKEEKPKIAEEIRKLWMPLCQNKERFINSQKIPQLISKHEYREMDNDTKQYPIIYEDGDAYKVVLKNGSDTKSFNTDFCAFAYALIGSADNNNIYKEIVAADRVPDAKNHFKELLKEMNDGNKNNKMVANTFPKIISYFNLKWIQDILHPPKEETKPKPNGTSSFNNIS